jgi:hypothetical protein
LVTSSETESGLWFSFTSRNFPAARNFSIGVIASFTGLH